MNSTSSSTLTNRLCNTIQMAFLPIFHTEWTYSRSSDYAFRFILYGKRQLPIRRAVRKRNVLRSESYIHPSSIHRANNNTCFLVSFGITVLLLYQLLVSVSFTLVALLRTLRHIHPNSTIFRLIDEMNGYALSIVVPSGSDECVQILLVVYGNTWEIFGEF